MDRVIPSTGWCNGNPASIAGNRQLVFDVTINVVFPAVLATFLFGGETLKNDGYAFLRDRDRLRWYSGPCNSDLGNTRVDRGIFGKVAKIVSLPVPEGVTMPPG